MNDPASEPARNLLAAQALLYASGELDESHERSFEQLLSQDQQAREALTRAAQVVFSQSPEGLTHPDPAYRRRVWERLQPRPWSERLWGRREYRGHPALWSVMGAAAAVALVLLLNPLFSPSRPGGDPQARQAHPTPSGQEPMVLSNGEELVSVELAEMWATLPRSGPDHLRKVHDEEQRKKLMAGKLDRLMKSNENRPRPTGLPRL